MQYAPPSVAYSLPISPTGSVHPGPVRVSHGYQGIPMLAASPPPRNAIPAVARVPSYPSGSCSYTPMPMGAPATARGPCLLPPPPTPPRATALNPPLWYTPESHRSSVMSEPICPVPTGGSFAGGDPELTLNRSESNSSATFSHTLGRGFSTGDLSDNGSLQRGPASQQEYGGIALPGFHSDIQNHLQRATSQPAGPTPRPVKWSDGSPVKNAVGSSSPVKSSFDNSSNNLPAGVTERSHNGSSASLPAGAPSTSNPRLSLDARSTYPQDKTQASGDSSLSTDIPDDSPSKQSFALQVTTSSSGGARMSVSSDQFASEIEKVQRAHEETQKWLKAASHGQVDWNQEVGGRSVAAGGATDGDPSTYVKLETAKLIEEEATHRDSSQPDQHLTERGASRAEVLGPRRELGAKREDSVSSQPSPTRASKRNDAQVVQVRRAGSPRGGFQKPKIPGSASSTLQRSSSVPAASKHQSSSSSSKRNPRSPLDATWRSPWKQHQTGTVDDSFSTDMSESPRKLRVKSTAINGSRANSPRAPSSEDSPQRSRIRRPAALSPRTARSPVISAEQEPPESTTSLLESGAYLMERDKVRKANDWTQHWLKTACKGQLNYTQQTQARMSRLSDSEPKRNEIVSRQRAAKLQELAERVETSRVRALSANARERENRTRRQEALLERERIEQNQIEGYNSRIRAERDNANEKFQEVSEHRLDVVAKKQREAEERRQALREKQRAQDDKVQALQDARRRLWSVRKELQDEAADRIAWVIEEAGLQQQHAKECKSQPVEEQVSAFTTLPMLDMEEEELRVLGVHAMAGERGFATDDRMARVCDRPFHHDRMPSFRPYMPDEKRSPRPMLLDDGAPC